MRTPSTLVLAALLGAACNQPPTAPQVAIEPAEPTTLDQLEAVIATPAEDPNDDPVTYTYAWFVNGTIVGDLDSSLVEADRTGRDQVWSVEVFASDGDDDSPVATAEVTILNSAPTVSVDLAPESPTTDQDLVATATTQDVDGDEVTLTWSWKRDGDDAGIDQDTVPASETASRQVWEVSVLASDGDLASEAAVASVTVDNTAPEVTSAALDPTELYDADPGEESVVRVVWEGEDADDDDLSAQITWFVNGLQVEGNDDGTLDGRSFDKGARVSAQVVASDGLDTSDPVTTEDVVVLNSPPALASVSIDPSSLTESSTATCVPAGWSDVDADPPSYQYSWRVNGTEVGSGTTLDGAAWDRGDSVTCVVTPFDGEDQGEPVTSAAIIIDNTPPTLAGVSLSPDPVRTGDDLTATPGATADADGDTVTLTYAWTVNGSAASGSGATLSSSQYEKGDTVVVTATPTDGSDTGTAQSASISVSNTAPVVTALTLTPSSPATDDALGVTWSASDADGDSLTTTISWTVDGSSAGTGTTLAASAFEKGDVVVASAVASDGTDTSPARTASVRIVNSPPTSPGLAMAPSSPSTSDDVQCRISTASTDPDSDPITYSFAWTINGSSYTSATTTTYTGDTVPSSATSGSDVLRCTVTASDGTASATPVATSATVKSGGATVPGFSGRLGPTFPGWTQCEGYLDVSGGDQIPKAWGDDCTGSSYDQIKLVCGASTSSYRYIDVNRNVFRDKLTAYSMSGLITAARDQSGSSFSINNIIYATGNDPHHSVSWWNGGNGCGNTNTNLTINNSCTWEASNCFGQGLTGSRYLWVYVAP